MSALKRMRKALFFIRCLALLCVVFSLFAFGSCTYDSSSEQSVEKLDFMDAELDVIKKYIEVGKYKGLDVSLKNKSRDEAVWDAVEKNFEIKEWPVSQLQYYRHQLESEYKYLAKKDGKSDSEIERLLEDSAGKILDEAKALTKSDLVYSVIVKIEKISVSADEKERLFDKYVEKYVSVYGYNAEYVKKNMADAIYSSMLYDKTTEFLLTNNNIKEK